MKLRAEKDTEEFAALCRILLKTHSERDLQIKGEVRLWWMQMFMRLNRHGLRVLWRGEQNSYDQWTVYSEFLNTLGNIQTIRAVLPALREATLLDRLADV
jgi:hypothetical protein